MEKNFRCVRSNIIAQLGPCIRPPNYEVDFAADILRQCREAGLTAVHDSARCTAADEERYYSYRREKGRTGRMLALLAISNPTACSATPDAKAETPRHRP
jgi:copper oxidase (laccase) domain-containing protein